MPSAVDCPWALLLLYLAVCTVKDAQKLLPAVYTKLTSVTS